MRTAQAFKDIPKGAVAFQIAVQQGLMDAASLLIDEAQGCGVSEQHLKALEGMPPKDNVYVPPDSLQRTPLHYLACTNVIPDDDTYKTYFQFYGHCVDVNKKTALMLAAQINNAEFIKIALN